MYLHQLKQKCCTCCSCGYSSSPASSCSPTDQTKTCTAPWVAISDRNGKSRAFQKWLIDTCMVRNFNQWKHSSPVDRSTLKVPFCAMSYKIVWVAYCIVHDSAISVGSYIPKSEFHSLLKTKRSIRSRSFEKNTHQTTQLAESLQHSQLWSSCASKPYEPRWAETSHLSNSGLLWYSDCNPQSFERSRS